MNTGLTKWSAVTSKSRYMHCVTILKCNSISIDSISASPLVRDSIVLYRRATSKPNVQSTAQFPAHSASGVAGCVLGAVAGLVLVSQERREVQGTDSW